MFLEVILSSIVGLIATAVWLKIRKKLKEDAPIILNHLCQSCNAHFKGILELVEENNIDYKPDPHLVRGLDYYNKTVFEIVDNNNHAFAFAGGGRYDDLVGRFTGQRVR